MYFDHLYPNSSSHSSQGPPTFPSSPSFLLHYFYNPLSRVSVTCWDVDRSCWLRSHAGNYGCSEFMSLTAKACPEDSISQTGTCFECFEFFYQINIIGLLLTYINADSSFQRMCQIAIFSRNKLRNSAFEGLSKERTCTLLLEGKTIHSFMFLG